MAMRALVQESLTNIHCNREIYPIQAVEKWYATDDNAVILSKDDSQVIYAEVLEDAAAELMNRHPSPPDAVKIMHSAGKRYIKPEGNKEQGWADVQVVVVCDFPVAGDSCGITTLKEIAKNYGAVYSRTITSAFQKSRGNIHVDPIDGEYVIEWPDTRYRSTVMAKLVYAPKRAVQIAKRRATIASKPVAVAKPNIYWLRMKNLCEALQDSLIKPGHMPNRILYWCHYNDDEASVSSRTLRIAEELLPLLDAKNKRHQNKAYRAAVRFFWPHIRPVLSRRKPKADAKAVPEAQEITERNKKLARFVQREYRVMKLGRESRPGDIDNMNPKPYEV